VYSHFSTNHWQSLGRLKWTWARRPAFVFCSATTRDK
jgi:hypothetical protein